MTKVLGAILIVLGIAGIVWGGFNYTTQKKIVDIGPIQAMHERTHRIPVPPVAGTIALMAGIAIFAVDKQT